MSNHKRAQNQGNNQNNGAPAQQQPPKKTFLERVRGRIDRIRTSKWGRRVIRTTEALGVAGACYGSYKLGQRNAKPTTVVIKPLDSEPEEEEIMDESPEEPIGEEHE